MIDSTAITRKVVRRALRIIRPSRPWVLAQHNPAPADVLSPIRLFAIVGAWMEGDVIAATVRNAFAQGCERVYLVDNDSPDDTVKEALSAGAVLAERFRTEQYDENLRLEVMNRVVQTVSNGEKGDHIWWLWLDADEFPHGPNGSTVFEFLGQIDRRFRIVGARFINHFPSSRLAYVSGFHPLDFQPLCEEHRFGCSLGHRKHPLQRFDRLGKRILCNRGFHTARSEERPLLEPSAPVFLHHFPYRNYEITKQRLTELCGKDFAGRSRVKSGDDAADGMIPRFQSLEAVYRGDWQHVRNYRPETGYSVPAPVPWPSLVGSEHLPVKRWYRQDNADHVHVSR